ncbi:hypothetical protein GA0070616_1372 [Micromonospora nigra]|uniref:Uncharacterized protein n=1 Tax=Micromonospora nigra TaxID=145857 RepID=A0A1C6RKZ5_9ACTN|nr:hypothetical protein GA0070616_1372 [Micromonospora nigra]
MAEARDRTAPTPARDSGTAPPDAGRETPDRAVCRVAEAREPDRGTSAAGPRDG